MPALVGTPRAKNEPVSQTEAHTTSSVDTSIASTRSRQDLQREIHQDKSSEQNTAGTKSSEISSLASHSDFEALSQQIKERHEKLGHVITHADTLVRGQESNALDLRNEINEYNASWSKWNPYSSKFWEKEATLVKQQELESTNNFIEKTKENSDALKGSLQTSEQNLKDAERLYGEGIQLREESQRLKETAEKLLSEKKDEEHHKTLAEAQRLEVLSLETMKAAQIKQIAALSELPNADQMRSLPASATQEYQAGLQQANKLNATAIENLNVYEERIRLARDATVVIGATVATGGIATAPGLIAAYGVVGTGVIATAAGTVAGTSIGIAATTAEQVSAVSRGIRDTDQAFQEGLTQVGRDAQSAFVTSAATATGIGLGSKLSPVLAKTISNQSAARITTGMLAGGGSSAVSTVSNEGIDVGLRGKEFDGNRFAHDLVKNTIAGSLGGGIGATGGLARNGSMLRGVGITGIEAASDAAVSVGLEALDARIQGREFSYKKAQEVLAESLRGTVLGEIGNVRNLTTPVVAGRQTNVEPTEHGKIPTARKTKAELDSSQIADQINGKLQNVTRQEIQDLINTFPEKDRALALKGLERLTAIGGIETQNALLNRLSELHNDGYALLNPGAGSLIDQVSYLQKKKSLDGDVSIREAREDRQRAPNLPDAISQISNGKETKVAIVLDETFINRMEVDPIFRRDIDRLMQGNVEVKYLRVAGEALNINGATWSNPARVRDRLAAVVDDARLIEELRGGTQTIDASIRESLVDTDIIRYRLNGARTTNAIQGVESTPWIGDRIVSQTELVEPAHSNQTIVGAEAHQSILNRLNNHNQISPEAVQEILIKVPEDARQVVQDALVELSEPYSYRRMGQLAQQHNQEIQDQARARGIGYDQIYYVAPHNEKSMGLVNTIYAHANGINPSNMVSSEHFSAVRQSKIEARYSEMMAEQRAEGNELKGARARKEMQRSAAEQVDRELMVVVLDDVAGSGKTLLGPIRHESQNEEMRNAVDSVRDGIGFHGHLVVAPMVSTKQASDRHIAKYGNDESVSYLAGMPIHSLTDSPFYRGLSDAQQFQLHTVLGGPDYLGYGGNGTMITFPYIAPNNNNLFFNRMVAPHLSTSQKILGGYPSWERYIEDIYSTPQAEGLDRARAG